MENLLRNKTSWTTSRGIIRKLCSGNFFTPRYFFNGSDTFSKISLQVKFRKGGGMEQLTLFATSSTFFFPLGSYQWDVTMDRDARAKLIVKREKFRPRRGGRREREGGERKRTLAGKKREIWGRLWKSGGASSTREASSFLAWQRPPTSLFLALFVQSFGTASSAATWSILSSSSVLFPTISRMVFLFFFSRVESSFALDFFFRTSGCRIFFFFF